MITASKVKELRERTGVGMSKCKEALEKSSGDIDKAIDHLRKAGIASSVKKGSREAKEGLIASAENDSHIALVEINSETDFVAKNDKFKDYLKTMAEEVLKAKVDNAEAFSKQKYSKDTTLTIDEHRATMVQLLGENIVIKRILLIEKKKSHSYGVYSHMQGRIVVCTELSKEGFVELARDVSMHIAAKSPEYLNPESVPESVKEHEKEIAKSQLKGKPENIIDKILQGKLQSYYAEECLTKQKYVKEDEFTVEEFLAKQDKDLKAVNFIRWQIGNN